MDSKLELKAEGKVFGYGRVSSREQNLERQIERLKPLLKDEHDLFLDKSSGKNFERKNYQIMKSILRKGDLVIFTSVDRMGRNYSEILAEWRMLTEDKGVDIQILDMEFLNTRKWNDNNLNSKFIANLTLEILSFVAQSERENILKRQQEGIQIAKNKGIKFGRPQIIKPSNFDEIYMEVILKNISAREGMRILGLKPNTFYKFAKESDKLPL